MGDAIDRGRRLLAAGLLVAALGLATGCGGEEGDAATTPVTTATTSAKDDRWAYARGLFREMCAGCHTLKDAGATGRRYDLDQSQPSAALADYLMTHGHRSDPGMPPFKGYILPREYDALVAYVAAAVERDEDDEPTE